MRRSARVVVCVSVAALFPFPSHGATNVVWKLLSPPDPRNLPAEYTQSWPTAAVMLRQGPDPGLHNSCLTFLAHPSLDMANPLDKVPSALRFAVSCRERGVGRWLVLDQSRLAVFLFVNPHGSIPFRVRVFEHHVVYGSRLSRRGQYVDQYHRFFLRVDQDSREPPLVGDMNGDDREEIFIKKPSGDLYDIYGFQTDDGILAHIGATNSVSEATSVLNVDEK